MDARFLPRKDITDSGLFCRTPTLTRGLGAHSSLRLTIHLIPENPLVKLVRGRGLPEDAEEWLKNHDAAEWSKDQHRSGPPMTQRNGGPSTIPMRHRRTLR